MYLVHLRLLSTSSVQSKLNQEELDLLLKPALHAHQHSDA